MLFKRKVKEVCVVDIGDGNCFTIPREVDEYIKSLILEKSSLKHRNRRLEEDLKEIKPIVNEATFKQAMTGDCVNCKYVMLSSLDGSVLCCMKDNVCEDFMPRK